MDAHGVRTIFADWGSDDEEIAADVENLLSKLKNGPPQIPLLAIFPAGRPTEVVRFGPSLYSREDIVGAIESASSGALAEQPAEEPPVVMSKLP